MNIKESYQTLKEFIRHRNEKKPRTSDLERFTMAPLLTLVAVGSSAATVWSAKQSDLYEKVTGNAPEVSQFATPEEFTYMAGFFAVMTAAYALGIYHYRR